MKKMLFLILALGFLPLFAQDLSDDNVRQAVSEALGQAQNALKSAPFGKQTVAILPFPGDSAGYFVGKLKNQLTALGFTCIEGKEDPMWDEIIREVTWDQHKDDILDSTTLVKFGQLKAAQILLYGKVIAVDKSANRTFAEIELHATDLKTKQHIWGGTFAARVYEDGKDVQGIIALDTNLRMLLKKNFEAAKESLTRPESAAKLDNVKSVEVLPLAGDIDEYMTGLAIEMLTETTHLPKRTKNLSPAQLRDEAKADPSSFGDAVLYGAVRGLCRTKGTSTTSDRKNMQETSMILADVQLFIEDLKSGNILWSKTVTVSEPVTEERPMTAEEREQAQKEFREGVGDSALDTLLGNWHLILLGIAGFVVLCFVCAFIKTYLTHRIVR